MIDKFDNKGGVFIAHSDVRDSRFSIGANSNPNIDTVVNKLLALAQEMETQLADKTNMPEDQKKLIQTYVDTIKVQAPTKNKNLLQLTLDGLRETLKITGDMLPNIAKTADAIKELF